MAFKQPTFYKHFKKMADEYRERARTGSKLIFMFLAIDFIFFFVGSNILSLHPSTSAMSVESIPELGSGEPVAKKQRECDVVEENGEFEAVVENFHAITMKSIDLKSGNKIIVVGVVVFGSCEKYDFKWTQQPKKSTNINFQIYSTSLLLLLSTNQHVNQLLYIFF